MKIIYIEPYLIASRPDMPYTNTHFVARTMNMLRATHGKTARLRLFARLQHLPTVAVIALAIAALTLVSGAAYAVYTFWIKPNVTTTRIGQNQYGRTEVSLNVVGCIQLKDKAVFEIKQGSALPATETAATVQARCETDAIQQWAYTSYTTLDAAQGKVPDQIITSVGTLETIDAGNVTLLDINTNQSQQLTRRPDTLLIDQAHVANMAAFQKGDSVMIVSLAHYKPEGGMPTSTEMKAVIKLSLPATYYAYARQNVLAQRTPCGGNPDDTCIASGAGGIDLYPHNEGSPDHPNPQGDTLRMIQGQLTSHNGTMFTVKGSSGATYTVTAPRDIINEFNTKYSKDYDGLQVKVGDTVTVRYKQNSNDDAKRIASGDISFIGLVLEVISKQNPIKKY